MANYEIADPNLLPCCNPDFSSIRESSLIYVDKTEIIAKIARQRTPIFLSRPRRFGKSLLVNTLSSLFSDGLRCFHGLDIEKIWNDKTYQVVVLDFSGLASRDVQEFKKWLCKRIITQFNYHKFSTTDIKDEHPAGILDEIVKELDNNSIVLLVDEYDAPLTHHLNDRTELNKIMAILNDFYAVVKQYTGKFRLIFITCVTRTSHVSIFSAFNNLIDLSFSEEYGSLLGFTYDDLLKYFDNYVCRAANFLEMTKDDVYARIKQYYDGFRFSFKSNQTVYNPWSILNFFF
ncbi:MAG: AAA family ATPase [Desulfovibrio sp.]|nr:AAA family ATPase [Desulfovibrio sp.]